MLSLFVVFLLFSSVQSVAVPAVNSLVPLPGTTPNPGTQVTYSMQMTNSGTTPGYVPFVDFAIPPGFTFNSVTVLTANPTTTVLNLAPGGCAAHPYAKATTGNPVQVCNDKADPMQIVVIPLPFLSYAQDQPPTRIDWVLDVPGPTTGTPVNIQTRTGLANGNDYLDNPTTDPSLFSSAGAVSTWFSFPATTVTDPPPPPIIPSALSVQLLTPSPVQPVSSSVYTQTINLGIPDTWIYQNINITDIFPPQLAFAGIAGITVTPAASYSVLSSPPVISAQPGTPSNAPNNTLILNFPGPLVGTAAAIDYVINVNYWIPQKNANGVDTIPPIPGTTATALHNVTFNGSLMQNTSFYNTTVNQTQWSMQPTINTTVVTLTQQLRSNALAQKGVAMSTDLGATGCTCCAAVPQVCTAGQKYTPGDTLQYTIGFPNGAVAASVGISSYFWFGNFMLRDTLSDGQRVDLTFTPTIVISGAAPVAFTLGTNYFIDNSDIGNDNNVATTGSQKLTFNISSILQSIDSVRFPSGRASSLPSPYQPFSFVITYRAVTLDAWTDNYWNTNTPPGIPGSKKAVVQGDVIGNTATLNMDIVNGTTGPILSSWPTITSATTYTADSGVLILQSIYGRNGKSCVPQPCQDPTFPPGTNITIRSVYVLPSADFDFLSFTFFLPYPLMDVANITTFDATIAGASVPALYHAKYGGDDTLYAQSGFIPTATPGSVSNRVDFVFPKNNNTLNSMITVDILFTVDIRLVTGFPDGTPINILGYSTEGLGGAQSGQQVSSTRTIIILNQADVITTLGVVAISNSGATISPAVPSGFAFSSAASCPRPTFPGSNVVNTTYAQSPGLKSTVTNADSGDLVTFALNVINKGAADAFDVRVRAVLPTGFALPSGGISLCVNDGTGSAITYTNVGGGTGLFDQGIELQDFSQLAGAIRNRVWAAANVIGSDVIVITYNLVITDSIVAGSNNTAQIYLDNFASGETGPNLGVNVNSTTTINILQPTMAKTDSFVSSLATTNTSAGNTAITDLAIGERVTFSIQLNMSEGTTQNVWVQDVIPSGLTYISSSIALGSQISLPSGSPTPIYTSANNTVQWNFGTVLNAVETPTDLNGLDSGDMITISVVLEASIANKGLAVRTLTNTAQFRATNVAGTLTSSASIEVVEPSLCHTVVSNATTGDAGNPFKITVTINHCGASTGPAYGMIFNSTQYLLLPPQVGSVVVSGTAAASIASGNTAGDRFVQITAPVLLPGQSLSITYTALMDQSVWPGTFTSGYTLFYESHPTVGAFANYSATSSITYTVSNPSVALSVVATSLAETTNAKGNSGTIPDLQRGETVTFQAVATLHEGTISAATIAATGFRITVSVGTTFRLTIINAVVDSIGSNIAVTSLAVGSVVAGTDSNADTALDTVTFGFGAVTNTYDNSATATAADRIVVNVTARVVDHTSAAAIATNNAKATIVFDTTAISPISTANVPVETTDSSITLTKSCTPTVGDAGDVITCTITALCRNDVASRGPCYSVNVTDLLPASSNLVFNPVSITATNTLVTSPPTSGGSTATYLEVIADIMGLNDQLTVSYTLTIAQSANPGTSVGTGATVWYYSAPKTATDTHLYTGTAAATAFTMNSPQIIDFKTLNTTLVDTDLTRGNTTADDLAVGESITVEIRLRIPEGTVKASGLSFMIDFNSACKFNILTAEVFSMSAQFSGASLSAGSFVGAADPDADGYFNRATFSFGPIVNTFNNVASDDIVLRVTGRLEDVSTRGTFTSEITGQVTWDSPGTAYASPLTIDLVEPTLQIFKTPNATTGDAGDWILFTVLVNYTTTCGTLCGPAYDLSFVDVLDSNFSLSIPSITASASPTATTFDASASSGNTVNVVVAKLLPGNAVTLTYTAQLTASVGLTTTVVNKVNEFHYSAPSTLIPRRKYTLPTASATITLNNPVIISYYVSATSNPDTGTADNTAAPDIEPSETVTYFLNMSIPEGTTRLVVTVALPFTSSEVEYLSSTVAFLGSNIACSTTCPAFVVGYSSAPVSNSGGTTVLETATFDFGTLVNTPDQILTSSDYIQLSVTGTMTANAINAVRTTVVSTATANYFKGSATATTNIDIVRPGFTFAKTQSAPPANTNDAGYNSTFTLTFTPVATSSAPMYGMVVTDIVNSTYLVQGNTIVITPTFTSPNVPVITSGSNTGDGTVLITFPRVPAATTVTISFVAQIQNTVVGGSTLFNTASYYGYHNFTASTYSQTYTGSSTSSQAIRQTTCAITSTTSLAETSGTTIAIGEDVTYTVTFTLSEGTHSPVVNFNVPTALTRTNRWKIASATVSSIGSQISYNTGIFNVGTSMTLTDGDTDTIADTGVINLGTIVDQWDNLVNTAADRLVFTVVVRTPNLGTGGKVAITSSPTIFTANMVPNGGSTVSCTGQVLNVAVPANPTATKTVSPSTTVDAGDVVTYNITITSPATAAANGPNYNLTVKDTLGPSWTLVVGTVTIGGSLGSTPSVVAGNTAGDTWAEVFFPFMLTGGRQAYVSFQARLTNTFRASAVNTASVGPFYSTPYFIPEQYIQYPGITVSRIISMTPPSIASSVFNTSLAETGVTDLLTAGQTDLAVGEEIFLRLRVTMPEGTLPIKVTFATGITNPGTFAVLTSYFLLGANLAQSTYTAGLQSPSSYTDSNRADGVLDTAVWDFYSGSMVVNSYDNVADANDFLDFYLYLRVPNITANAAGSSKLTTTFTFTSDTLNTTSTLNYDIVQPVVDITKTANATAVDAGDFVKYTITLKHNGASTGPMYNVAIYDYLTSRSSLVAGSVTTTAGTIVSSSGYVYVTVPTFARTDPDIVVTYVAVMGNTLQISTQITNTATFEGFSAPANGRWYTGSATASTNVSTIIVVNHNFTGSTNPETGSTEMNTNNNDVTIGEIFTTSTYVLFAEGYQDLRLAYSVPTGPVKIEFLNATIISVGSNLVGLGLTAGQTVTANDTNADGVRDSFIFVAYNMFNTPDNVVTAGDELRIEIYSRFIDVSGNVPGTSTGTVQLTSTTILGTQTLPIVIDLVGPDLTISTTVAYTNPADAGDNVVVTVDIAHSGTSTAAAYNLNVQELFNSLFVLHTGASYVSSKVSGVSFGTLVSGLTVGDTAVQMTAPVFTKQANHIFVVFLVHLADAVGYLTLPTISKSASVYYQSDPNYALRNATKSSSTTVTVTNLPVLNGLTIASTSDPNTVAPGALTALQDLALGETITVRLSYTIKEGTSKLTYTMNLPSTGCKLIPVSAKVTTWGTNMTSSTGQTLNSGPSSVSDVNFDGFNEFYMWDFGTVVNSGDNSAGNDVIVVEIVSYAATTNTAGSQCPITGRLDYTTSAFANSTVTTEIVAPVLSITKTSPIATPADAGDSAAFTVTIAHTGGSSAPAYGLNMRDILSSYFALVTGAANVKATISGAGVGSFSSGLTGGDTSVIFDLATFSFGSPALIITYTAPLTTLVGYLTPSISNTANLTYYTQPPSTAVVNKTTVITASVTIPIQSTPISIPFSIVSTSDSSTGTAFRNAAFTDLAIGEYIRFKVGLTLREGTSLIALTIALPPASGRIRAVNASVVSLAAGVTNTGGYTQGALATLVDANSDGLPDSAVFDFGTVVNPGNNVANANDNIEVDLTGLVVDDPLNVPGTTTYVTTALANYTTGQYSGSITTELVGPVLNISKIATYTAAAASGDAWDTITFTITTAHTSASMASAYALNISDFLSTYYYVLLSGAGAVTATHPSAVVVKGNTAGDSNVQVTVSEFKVTDSPVVVTFSARLNNTVGFDVGSVNNTGQVDYTSQLTTGRFVTLTSQTTSLVNSTPSFFMNISATSNPQTDKLRYTPTNTDLSIGETVTFLVGATLREGTNKVTMTVQLATTLQKMSVVSARVYYLGSNIYYSSLATNAVATSITDSDSDGRTDRAFFDFGYIVNMGDNAVDDRDRIYVEVTGVVNDVAANTPGSTLPITATLDYTNGAFSAATTLDVVGPVLTITKTNNLTLAADAGDSVLFTVTISHVGGTSTGPAYQLNLTDTLSGFFEMLANTVATGTAISPVIVSGNAYRDNNLLVYVPVFDITEPPIVITYRVRINETAGYTTPTIGNTAAMNYKSSPVAAGKVFTSSASTSITINRIPTQSLNITSSSAPETGYSVGNVAFQDLGFYEIFNLTITLNLFEGAHSLKITVDMPVSPWLTRISVLSSRVDYADTSRLVGALLSSGSAGTASDTNADTFPDRVVFDFGAFQNLGDNVFDLRDTITLDVIGQVQPIYASNGEQPAITLRADWGNGIVTSNLNVDIVNSNTPPTSPNPQNVSVAETLALGATVYSVVATDLDFAAPMNVLNYTITAGNKDSTFAINPTTGVITVASTAGLSYEQNQFFNLTVVVMDQPGLFVTTSVLVTVLDIDELPVVAATQTYSVLETAPVNTLVGSIGATDPDVLNATFSTLTYTILSGNTNGAFSMNSATGDMRVANISALSFVTQPVYTIVVNVADGGGLAVNVTVTVNLIPTVCGDGMKHFSEQCDDGNTVSFDGCSSTCTIEPFGACTLISTPYTMSVCRAVLVSPGSVNEYDIIDTGLTIFLRIVGDTWNANIGTNAGVTSAFLSQLNGVLATPYAWASFLRPTLGVGTVVLVNSTTVRINIAANTKYAIDADDGIFNAGFTGAMFGSTNALAYVYAGLNITNNGLRVFVTQTGNAPFELPCIAGANAMFKILSGHQFRILVQGTQIATAFWQTGAGALTIYDSLGLLVNPEFGVLVQHTALLGRPDFLVSGSFSYPDDFSVIVTFTTKPCGAFIVRNSSPSTTRTVPFPAAATTSNTVGSVTISCKTIYA